MTLANGRHYLAIPGPSVMPDRVLAAMHRASPNIYEGGLHDLVSSLWPDLKALAGTTGDVAAYIGNGHAIWEAANANLFSRGDKALVLAVGQFGLSWAASARAMGIEVEVLDFGKSAPVDMARVEAALRADREGRIKAVLTTHVDTASTIRTDIAGLRRVIDAVPVARNRLESVVHREAGVVEMLDLLQHAALHAHGFARQARFATSATAVKAAASRTARSANIFRSMATLLRFRPAIKTEYESPFSRAAALTR